MLKGENTNLSPVTVKRKLFLKWQLSELETNKLKKKGYYHIQKQKQRALKQLFFSQIVPKTLGIEWGWLYA